MFRVGPDFSFCTPGAMHLPQPFPFPIPNFIQNFCYLVTECLKKT
nr:MAG TPA: hypothetical protein [Caudoviricetes sp.]